MLKLEHGLAFETPKFYIAPYDKINHALVNLSYNCDMKIGPKCCYEELIQIIITSHLPIGNLETGFWIKVSS